MKNQNEELIKKMTLDEKISLLNGTNFFYTRPLKRLDIRPLTLSDGPHGLRKQINGDNLAGFNLSEKAVCFPSSGTSAQSFDEEVYKTIGDTLALEAQHYGVDVVLGPAINIQRNPLCGRHFEYVSEDPYLAGKFAINYINGMQKHNIGASIKHFAANNNENIRLFGSSYIDKRALFDIYLKPFEMAIKETQPYTVMCAYNKLNGTYCAENKFLIEDTLRNRFGFQGLVMTDWGATNKRSESIKVGLDLEMPGSSKDNDEELKKKIENHDLDEKYLDRCVNNYLNLVNKIDKKILIPCDFDKHHEIAIDIASKSAVLLKNENMLPLNKNDEFIIIGELFKKIRYQGMGSSLINPYKLDKFDEIFKENNINYKYYDGYKINEVNVSLEEERKALSSLNKDSKVLLFLGLNDLLECEGMDRKNLSLPENQLNITNNILKITKNVTVILFTGSPVELPFINDINALLLMGLGGEGVAKATYKLLFNEINPSGRLTSTYVKKESDILFNDEFKNNKDILYKESIFVGYRYYHTFNKEVLFPFGYGLSYSKFEYSNFLINKIDDKLEVSLKIKNISPFKGSDVIQIYYNLANSNYFRSDRNLISFKKVNLDAFEEKTITFNIDLENLKIFNLEADDFLLEEGDYEIFISKNVNNSLYSKVIKIDGSIFKNHSNDYETYYSKEDLLKINNEEFFNLYGEKIILENTQEVNIYSPLKDFNNTHWFGKLFYKIVSSTMKKEEKDIKKITNLEEKENAIKSFNFTLKQSDNFTLNAMTNMGNTPINKKLAKLIVDLANGHHLKAYINYFKKD